MIQSMRRLNLPPPRDLAALRRALLAWHRRNGLQAPWRTSGDPYHVLVAAVMAQQTQISRVLLKFDEFVAAYPTVEALAQAPTSDVLRLWAPLGYNVRALRLQRAAQLVVDAGGFPRTVAELERYVARRGAIGDFLVARVKGYSADHYAWSKVIWDIAAIGYLLEPRWVSTNLVPSPILTDQLTWSVDHSRHLIRIATAVHRDPIFRDLFQKLEARWA